MRVVSMQGLGDAVAAAVAGTVADGGSPRVVVSGNLATPATAVAVIADRLDRVTLHLLNAQPPLPDRDGVTLETCFVGPAMRRSPRLRYVPARLSLVPRLFRTTLPPDVVLLHTSLPRDGKVSLGIEVNVLPAAVEAARDRGGLVVAVANARMPYTFGDGELDVEDLDLLVETDEPLAAAHPSAPDPASERIGALVAERVVDGACLQAGIGAVPDAVMAHLTGRHDLRVWTETFGDGVLALEQAGRLDRSVPLTATFLIGSEAVTDWADRNPRLRMRRTEIANDPAQIALHHHMVSVNTALEVDLFGQANASRIDARIYSGFGGSTDFIVGALHSPGGMAVMALRSWHPKADVSTVIPLLGEPVTSFQPSMVVTENGIAAIGGTDERTQAALLIEQAAHPRVRDELWEEARALGLA